MRRLMALSEIRDPHRLVIVFQQLSKVGLIDEDGDTTRPFLLLAGEVVRTEKSTCCPRSHFLQAYFMVESAENGTGNDPQFPLLGGADCTAFHGTAVALAEFPVRDYSQEAPWVSSLYGLKLCA